MATLWKHFISMLTWLCLQRVIFDRDEARRHAGLHLRHFYFNDHGALQKR